MKTVSAAFTDAVHSASKQYNYKALFSWDKSTDNGEYVYTDEGGHCASFSVTRKTSKHPWGLVMATAKITLNNATGRFFPGKDAAIGAYVGLPDRPIRLQVGVGNEYINLFTGFGERPRVSLVGSQLTLSANDVIIRLKNKTSALGGQTGKRLDQIIALLLQEAGFTDSQYELDISTQGAIGYCAPNNKKISDVIDELCQAEQYLVFADGDGKIHGWNASHQATISTTSWDFTVDNATSIDFAGTSVLNDVLVETKPFQPVAYSKIFSNKRADDSTLVPANGTLDIWANLADADNNTIYAIDVDNPTYGGEGVSNYLTNVSADGTGADNSAAISVKANSIMGATIKTTFANSSSIPTYITQLEFFGTSAQQQNYTSKRAIDRTSIATYGTNPDDNGETYVISSEYIQSSENATQVATRMVLENSSPYSQITMGTFIVPQLEMGDLVAVTVKGLLEQTTFQIMGITFSAGESANFKQTLILDEFQQSNYFVLDSSALDGGRILAP